VKLVLLSPLSLISLTSDDKVFAKIVMQNMFTHFEQGRYVTHFVGWQKQGLTLL
jgi:hypothetical protein